MANTTWSTTDKTASCALTGSNLIATSTSGFAGVRAVDIQLTGKFYWEVTCNTFASGTSAVGFTRPGGSLSTSPGTAGAGSGVGGVTKSAGNILIEGVSGGSLGAISSGNVICVAVDCGASLIWFRLGAVGNWNGAGTANPAIGVGGNAMPAGRAIPFYPAAWLANTSEQVTANFGDTAFVGAVPSGYTSGFTAGAATTWSPTDILNTTLSGGNLTATGTASQGGVRATDFKTTGKFYWELVFNATGSATDIGIALPSANLTNVGSLGANAVLMIIPTGTIYVNGGSVVTLGGFPASGTIAVAVDFTAKLLWLRCITVAPGGNNPGSWNGTVTNDPAAGTGGASFASLSGNWYPIATFNRADVITANFTGAFAGPIPAGFSAFSQPSVTIPTNAIASQALAEHWLTTNPDAQTTQVVLEHWASTTSTGLQAVITQVALEHWASVANVLPQVGGPIVTMIH